MFIRPLGTPAKCVQNRCGPTRFTVSLAREIGNGVTVQIAFFLCLLPILSAKYAIAVDPHTLISQYGHTAWRIEDGAFSSQPAGITQTTDGYIWIATFSGLVRFDGVRFVAWTPIRGEHLPSFKITTVLGARDDSLWIGTGSGLARLKNGHVTTYPDINGYINGVVEDRTGTIWVARSRGTGPVCKVTEFETRCYGQADGFPFQHSNAIVEGASRDIWIGSYVSLARWNQGSLSIRAVPALNGSEGTNGINSLAAAEDGTLWVGTARPGPGGGLQRIVENKWKPLITNELDSSTLAVNALLLDREGMLWVGTNQGVYRIYNNAFDRFGSADGLSGNFVNGFFQDREGNVWISTTKGIDRFRDLRVVNFSQHEGLSADAVDSVLAARDGTVWIGNLGALDSLRHGKVTAFVANHGLPGVQVTSLFEDHASQIWVGVDNSLFVYKEGRFNRINKRGGRPFGVVVSITEDTDNNVWAKTVVPGELVRIRDGKVREEVPWSQTPKTLTLAADPKDGVWFGILGGFGRLQNGHLDIFPFKSTDKMEVYNIIVNTDGSVLGGTSLGLLGWRSGKFQLLDLRNGLPCNNVYTPILDNHGTLWLSSQCGLIVIAREELERWWENSTAVVKHELLDILDGAQPSSPPFRPNASRSPDGRLWFANESVLQMVDPNHQPRYAIPPPVHIEELIADQTRYSPQTGLRIPPRLRNLEIDYTALSFAIPQRVRFRCKLEGHDTAWHDIGTRRQVFYSDLRPGRYRFRVVACSGDGVWNEEGATLEFEITPAWYQTNWFRLLCLVSGGLAIWAIYRFRVRQIARVMSARFDERLAERTRIARDLHDTFLQTIQGSKLVADNALDPDADPAGMPRAMEQLSAWLGRATQESRAVLNSLRGPTEQRNDLGEALQHAIEECRLHSPIEASFSVVGTAEEMHPIVRDEIYRISYEAIRNACVHSMSTRLEVGLSYSQDLSVRVRDNGVGIDPAVLEKGKQGHFGLQGIRERAARIRGKLTVVSSPNSGTEVTLVVPGRIVFRTANQTRLGNIRRFFTRSNSTLNRN